MRSTIIAAAVIGSLTLSAQAQQTGHPLIKVYPGATLLDRVAKEYDEQIMLLGPIAPDKSFKKSQRLEGKVTRLNYADPAGRSTLEKYKNYEDALKAAGFEVLWTCAGYDVCGPQTNVPTIGYFPYSSEQGRYLTARLKRAEGDVWVGLQVKPADTSIQIVEAKPMETGMVKVDADALGKSIMAEGHVPVYGIYFDTGKADLKPESSAALKEIAALLQKLPTLKIHVVGHTDNVGELAANLDLSRRRAAAVVAALTQTHGVAAARLRPEGVGPLAPVASNDTDAGKAKNRRVELVKQ